LVGTGFAVVLVGVGVCVADGVDEADVVTEVDTPAVVVEPGGLGACVQAASNEAAAIRVTRTESRLTRRCCTLARYLPKLTTLGTKVTENL